MTETTTLDVTSPIFRADPYPIYARLRAQTPVQRIALAGKQTAWLVTRYDDVLETIKSKQFAKDRLNALPLNQTAKQPWVPKFVKPSVIAACGGAKGDDVTDEDLQIILKGLIAWTSGKPLAAIEIVLGGDPNSDTQTKRVCPRSRELVGSVIPRGFSFIMGLLTHVVGKAVPIDTLDDSGRQLLECLGTAVRRGYDTPAKVVFADQNPTIFSRVQMHQSWTLQSNSG